MTMHLSSMAMRIWMRCRLLVQRLSTRDFLPDDQRRQKEKTSITCSVLAAIQKSSLRMNVVPFVVYKAECFRVKNGVLYYAGRGLAAGSL